MPHKDPETYRQYKKEQMRERRARQKEQAGATSSPANMVSSPVYKSAAPIPEPSPAAKLNTGYDISPEFQPGVPGCMWKKFPWEKGRKCFNADGQCCYDLEFPVPWERVLCPNEHPLNCEYFRKTDVRDYMEPLVEVKS